MVAHSLMILSNPYSHDGRVRREVRELVAAGWAVTVIAWDRAGDGPGSETMDGANIVRLASTTSMRMRGYDLFRLGAWNRLAARAAATLHASKPITVVHAHDLDTLPAALLLKRRLGLPVLYDAHEVWGYMIAKDLPRFVCNHYLRKEQQLLPHVDHVVTVSEAVARHLRPHTSAPIDLVMNAKQPLGSHYAPPESHEGLEVAYIGVLNRTRLVHELIDAVAEAPGWSLFIAGYGPAAYEAKIRAAAIDLPNVTFAGRIDQDQVLPRTLAADVVACPFDPEDPLTRIGMPNKVFEAMACGRPVLTTSGTHLGDFVVDHKMGLAVSADVTGLRAGLDALGVARMRQDMGQHAYQLGRGEYGWAAQTTRLLAAYDRLSSLHGRATSP